MNATDIDAVKAAAELARIIGETLILHRSGRDHVGLCPFHNERTPSFTVFCDHYHCFGCGAHGDAIDWLTRARGMSFGEALAYLDGGGSGVVLHGARPKRQADHDAGKRNAALARTIWSESCLPSGTIVEDYLRSRGLKLPDEPVLRFHPQCPRGDERAPAMVALMTDPVTREPRGIHRTFLRPDGGGHVGKMMLGHAGIIRLYEPETAAWASRRASKPLWPSRSASAGGPSGLLEPPAGSATSHRS